MWIYLFEILFLLCSEIWNFDQTVQERCFYIFLVRASFTKIKKKWCCDPFDHSVHIDHPCPCNPIFFFFTLPSSSSGQSMFDGEGSVRSITNQLCSMPPDGLWASSGVDFGGAHEDPYFDCSESLTGQSILLFLHPPHAWWRGFHVPCGQSPINCVPYPQMTCQHHLGGWLRRSPWRSLLWLFWISHWCTFAVSG